MKLKRIVAIAFGATIIIPAIGFSEDYNQMLEQAQDQNSEQQSNTSENPLMSEYGEQSNSTNDNALMSEYEQQNKSQSSPKESQAEKLFEQNN